jgi:phosphoserine phosphatase RsbU/P
LGRQALDRIIRSTQRAQRLIEDLLDFTVARVGSGLAVKLAPIDIHQVAASAAEELRTTFPGREIEHQSIGHGACCGDADRLTQAIGNLVVNAMTYGAFDRPVRLTSRIEPETFAIEVHNAGKPIPADQIAALFEPMARGSASGNTERSVGLGLFIVREIVRAHGGEVGVESRLEAGTTFLVRCPR